MSGRELPRELTDDDYGADGWPLAEIVLTRHTYMNALGRHQCWVAQFKGLPGYFGEGETPSEAVDRLRLGLGPRPHYRVEHKFRSSDELKADIRRKYRAKAAAALTRADGLRRGDLGGGWVVDAAAKRERIGKPSVTEARAKLSEEIDRPDGKLQWNVSAETLETAAASARKQMDIDIWMAEETPWRLDHAVARDKFPTKKG